jgi:phosphoribosylaminoimidazolecarboxamide formyltransferase/IMP cyclohydrolase
MQLRYGINPHQAARVVDRQAPAPVQVVHGQPSYINLLDALTGWQLVAEASAAVGRPVAASIKHVSPAGVAAAGPLDAVTRETWGLDTSAGPLTAAYARARDADPKSSFGDLIAVSEPVDAELADLLRRVVSDGVIAPGFEPGVAASLAAKKHGRFLVLEAARPYEAPVRERREVLGLTLEQEADLAPITAAVLHPAGLRAAGPAADGPSAAERPAAGQGADGPPAGVLALPVSAVPGALIAMVTARYTQSNSIALVRDGVTVGIGAGQQNRVDCVRLAAAKARVWWLRRHDQIRALPLVAGMSRQDRLNWQIRMADGDLTPVQRAEFGRLFPGTSAELTAAERARWAGLLTGVTLASDGYLPFRDNIDHASQAGVRHVVEPGGSSRSDEVAAACAEYGMTLTRTGLRLFRH